MIAEPEAPQKFFPPKRQLVSRWLMVGVLGAAFLTASAEANDDRFSVFGWVKHKLSPEEEARSAARADRLRPLSAPDSGLLAAHSATMNPNAVSVVPSRPPTGPATIAPPSPAPMAPAMIAPPPPQPAPITVGPPPPGPTGPATVPELRRRAEFLATRGLGYKFGGDHPTEGGMDCSGTMQFLLKSIGYTDIPRTSYAQFDWLNRKGTLKKVGFFRSRERAIRNFRPGDLIFWGGTYNSGHKVSHVMIYLGRHRNGTHYVFGARGKKTKGLNGNGVDIFEFKPESTGGRLVGYGSLPGLRKG